MPPLLPHDFFIAWFPETQMLCKTHNRAKGIGNVGNRKRNWKFNRALDKLKKVV